MSDQLDVVYVCEATERNEELRHSLRSLVNLPHGRVWLVGYKPRWARNVEYIPTSQRSSKHINTWRNWQAIAAAPELPDQFVLFNDDFYITRPIETVPGLHRGLLADSIELYRQKRLAQTLARATATQGMLRRAGRDGELYSYELHAPMMIDRAALAEAVAWVEHNHRGAVTQISKRTLYGNWARAGGVGVRDVKVQRADAGLPDTDLPFLSTSPLSWQGLAGGWVRRTFAVPSMYEPQPGDHLYRPPVRERADVRRATTGSGSSPGQLRRTASGLGGRG